MKGRLPAWFKQRPPSPPVMLGMERLLQGLGLHTICESARCPNIGGCFSQGTATFLILGDVCTRRCAFCAVRKGSPALLDINEPQRLLEAARKLNLKYIVVTSVTRDDLADGGASQFVKVINLLHQHIPGVTVEVLVPDFLGAAGAITMVAAASPGVINHNVETVPRLYPRIRPGADYHRSVTLLARVKEDNSQIVTKSGLMLGLGETREEIIEVMGDLREAGCDLLTLGQYLQPSPVHHPVARFLPPEEFSEYERLGSDLGFAGVVSAPLVRSSFKAVALYARVKGA